jgi:hypothetical protein
VQLPSQLCETQPHHSEPHKHIRVMLVADLQALAELDEFPAELKKQP